MRSSEKVVSPDLVHVVSRGVFLVTCIQVVYLKWLKVEGSANSIHIEKKLYYALATKKATFKIMMMNLIFLKKVFFLGYFM